VTPTPLLDEVIEAHGGKQRWQTVTGLSVDVSAGGLAVTSKFQRSGLRDLRAEVSSVEQRLVFRPYPRPGHRGVFDLGTVRVETDEGLLIHQRLNPRSDLGNLRHVLWWDHLDLLYFGGSALWTYLATPYIFATPGFKVAALDPWAERDEIWRPLAVTFPAELHTHSRQQVFYFGKDGLLRRMDYTAEEFGGWAKSVHYCYDYRDFGGYLTATRRRVYIRRSDNRSRRHPLLLWIDIRDVAISAK
jgi:hypothetical protein